MQKNIKDNWKAIEKIEEQLIKNKKNGTNI